MNSKNSSMSANESEQQVPFSTFLNNLKSTLKSVFYEKDNIETFIRKRGFPALVLRDIMAQNPLSVGIPKQYGGRGARVKECLGILEAASYESLPLSLTFGINIALFLQPVAKYGEEQVKEGIFNRFLTKQNMGGLMITEPDFGSDALNMQTSFTRSGATYHLQGTKHWQGLTGLAADAVEANSMKAYITDLMQESAHTLTQLIGANGYKAESLGARGIVDSRPFQIFEGSNEMLYTQISESVTKLMIRTKTMNLYNFLKTYDLTSDVAHLYNTLLNFTVDLNLQQRKHVDLGKIISRVVSTGFLYNLGKNGFRNDLIHNATETIKHEIAMLVSSYKFELAVVPIEDYHSNSTWLNV